MFRCSRAALVYVALTAAALTATLVPAVASAAAPAPSPWLGARYNAAGSNANLAETTLTTRTIGAATALRTIAPFGRNCFGYRGPVGAPLLDQSRVYALSGTALASFDAQTGAQLWRSALPQYDEYQLIAVSHGLIVVAGNACDSVSDPLGDVLAFNVADGSPAWTLPRPYEDAFVDASVSGQFLVVKTGEYPDARELSVYRVQDAHPVWTVSGSLDGPDPHTGDVTDASARVVAGEVFVDVIDRFGFPELQARDLATGAVRWTRSPSDLPLVGDSDTVAGTTAYDSAGADLDPATGAPRYRLSSATTVLAVDTARVYATCAPDSTIVCGFDRSSGVRSWLSGTKAPVSRAISAGGLLYLSTGQVLNAGNGHLVRTLPGVPVAVGQGRVAVQRKSGGLVLYGLPGA